MAISLFAHNETAYRAADALLAEAGKAAVIHPTGTGKSFIGFKLCEDHPRSRVCWLSPSEYIFKTQQENLAATGAEVPENISFCTYAKLLLMRREEMEAIRPDYIILDEFHRCGAQMWGQGVQALLELYPQVPLLGLSATNIRYLDNQRDMAQELFGGNIASEMTLGEAIVRGILTPPKYILSVYAYQKDLETYRKRVRRNRNPAARDMGEQYLEALRRALDQAEGLDEVFSRHMTNRRGKYIVFCASAEHMKEMMAKVPEWFGKVDPAPHVYSAYSNDPETDQAFADFKADCSGHLKLLFSIDMLNEGIHVEDVSGVILLRPTVSPIIYKQQIGRALAAGKGRQAVIFDIVNNIENLCSISAIQQEMRVAMTYYRASGQEGKIFYDRFDIIDEVGDSRRLFETLSDTLTASWEVMYDYARKYWLENGHLEVPRRYKTPEGYSLGSWIFTQRKVYRGEQYGVLGEDRIARLEKVGMVWEGKGDLSWNRYYGAARAYYREKGDLDLSVAYVTGDGIALGKWISQMRTYRKSGIRQTYLTKERIAALDALGMIWSVPDHYWTQNYHAALRYHRQHGHLDVPYGYTDSQGVKLGVWVRNMRASRNGERSVYRITPEQERQLEELGMRWEGRHDRRWEEGFREAEAYRERFGDLEVPAGYVSPGGFALGKWLNKHREMDKRTGKTAIRVTPERRERLSALGMRWDAGEDPWEKRYGLAREYYEAHGDLQVPAQYVAQGVWLHKWLNEQKQIYRGNRPGKRLTEEQIRRLEAIGIRWGREKEAV